ncbi:THUMP domain-containing protein 2 isoform X2 [Pseudoliparis swirei]|uniref:THUMP domain-containing protein 2 isoform X2 n=1 Tax=Pseudoliparis swirei TaxID=2059687 RepID=UPI0024BD7077|nr:THUMP domain-containing protein 2 isoform X2 [Pseudoliparis swirei]
MSDPDTGGSVVRYYCTAGNGMERFLIGEVKEKLAAEDVCQTAGKVLFSSSAAIHRVSALKAAERLFLLLRSDAPLRLPPHSGPANAAALLRSRLLGDVSQWAGAAVTWRRLQGELATRRTEEGRRGERERGDEESSEAPTLKRERDEEEEKESERKRRCEEDDGGEEASAENMHHVKPSAGALPPEPALSFRVSCKCTGSLSRCFGSQEVSRLVGGGLSRLLGWRADLKNPQLDVNVSLSNDHFLLGFPLTRLPLANRSYMKTTGLRSTVAWAMASLAQIQPGSCVVDPMCGVGTILIEAAQEHEAACFLGLDLDDGQLQRANENVEFAELGDRMQLLKASCMRLPLSSGSVDAVVCDLPFGRKFGTKTNMAANLPLILTEMERVLRVGGTLVLLLSPQLSCLLKALLNPAVPGPAPGQEAELQREPPPPRRSLEHRETLRVSLGAIDGLIHKYVKTDI